VAVPASDSRGAIERGTTLIKVKWPASASTPTGQRRLLQDTINADIAEVHGEIWQVDAARPKHGKRKPHTWHRNRTYRVAKWSATAK
jgi:hypothetical protein